MQVYWSTWRRFLSTFLLSESSLSISKPTSLITVPFLPGFSLCIEQSNQTKQANIKTIYVRLPGLFYSQVICFWFAPKHITVLFL